jgi:hypothetical protein
MKHELINSDMNRMNQRAKCVVELALDDVLKGRSSM